MKFSLIIATYNRSRSLVRALESVVLQTASPVEWECVVVNNNSTDSTAEDFATFAVAHPQFNLRMVGEPRQGLSNARNCGIANSSGEYIAIIDDDETIVPEYVEAYIDFFDRCREALAAGGAVIARYETARPKWMSRYTEHMIANPIEFGRGIHQFPAGRIPAGGNMAFRREAFARYGGFNPALGRNGKSLSGGEESDLFERMRAGGEVLYYVPRAAIYHYIPDEKLSAERFERLSYAVGRSKYLRAELHGTESALLADEKRKRLYTAVLALFYVLTFRPAKAKWLVAMRCGIGKGIADQKSE